MNSKRPLRSVVVGIDGSQPAIRAAQWAIDEAVNRGVPLRLVHVIHGRIEQDSCVATDNERVHLEYGETALRMAAAAGAGTGQQVKIETEILRGDPAAALIAESEYADMVCVGSVGIGGLARAPLGSTAAELAIAAKCPVAIIRNGPIAPKPDSDWIAFALNDLPESDHVVSQAMDEARLRHAPVFAVGVRQVDLGRKRNEELKRRVEVWGRRYPGVRLCPMSTCDDIASFLADNHARVQLAVIGGSETDQVTRLIGPHCAPVHGRAGCSILVVHG